MSLRPVDIARQLKISTTTLRKYEDMGLVPKTSRTPDTAAGTPYTIHP